MCCLKSEGFFTNSRKKINAVNHSGPTWIPGLKHSFNVSRQNFLVILVCFAILFCFKPQCAFLKTTRCCKSIAASGSSEQYVAESLGARIQLAEGNHYFKVD